jgi:hypothetical protein
MCASYRRRRYGLGTATFTSFLNSSDMSVSSKAVDCRDARVMIPVVCEESPVGGASGRRRATSIEYEEEFISDPIISIAQCIVVSDLAPDLTREYACLSSMIVPIY